MVSFIENPGETRSFDSPISLEFSITTSDAAGSIPPLPTNQVPSVSISSPFDSETLPVSSSVTIEAVVSDVDGDVVSVDFSVDGASIGVDQNGNNGWKMEWTPPRVGTYTLSAVATDNDGASTTSDPVSVTFEQGQPTANENDGMVPEAFAIHQNFPNPFNDRTTFTFDIPQTSHVNLSVYDLSGRQVDTLLDENLSLGKHQMTWEGNNLPSGVYLIRMQTDDGTFYSRATLLK